MDVRELAWPEKLAYARKLLLNKFPFLAPAAYVLVPLKVTGDKEQELTPKLTCDRYGRVYYTDRALEVHTPQQLALRLLHIIGHLLGNHVIRFPNAGALENLCCCLEIDSANSSQDLQLQTTDPYWILPAAFGLPDGLLAEEYYQLLQQRLGELQQDEKFRQLIEQITQQSCGSCAGRANSYERPGSDKDVPSLSDVERNLIRIEVARRIEEHIRNSQPGTIPGNLLRLVDLIAAQTFDIRVEMQAAIQQELELLSGNDDYSYARPSRRWSGDVIRPSMVASKPRVLVIGDTSNSMTDTQCGVILGIVKNVIEQYDGEIMFMACDAEPNPVQRIQSASAVKLVGGGGTNMAEGIRAALRLRPEERPGLVVVITDGETPWPEEKPPIKVIVCLVTDNPEMAVPPWVDRCIRYTTSGQIIGSLSQFLMH